MRRPFHLSAWIMGCMIWLTGCLTAEPPNLLLILMDDMGWNDVGANTYPSPSQVGPPPASVSSGTMLPSPNHAWENGASLTPRIDSLGTQGVRMTRFLATSPVCSPTRAALMTGRYPRRVGMESVVGPYPDQRAENGLSPAEITLAERLRERGYHTALVGKWHLGHAPDFFPTRHGFRRFFGILYSNDMWTGNAYTPVNWGDMHLMENEAEVASHTTGSGHTITGPINTNAEQAVLFEAMTEEALAEIQAAHDQQRPFFVLFAPHAPHVPVFPHPDFQEPGGTADPRIRYRNILRETDARIGQLLDRLDQLGITSETLVVFTSDNGPWFTRRSPSSVEQGSGSAYPFRGSKNESWEGGHRVPFFARYPGHFPAGTVLDTHATTLDLYTTFLTAAGAPVPVDRPVDGRDMGALLRGESVDSLRENFAYYDNGDTTARGLLEADAPEFWKLLNGQLYRTGPGFTQDVQESTDLSSSFPADHTRLTSALNDWNNAMVPGQRVFPRSVFIELETDEVNVPENGTAQIRFRLSGPLDTTVTVSRFSGDPDLGLQGAASFDFTTTDWNQWRTVTFTAVTDEDGETGGATFRLLGENLHLREVFVFEEERFEGVLPSIPRLWPRQARTAVPLNQPVWFQVGIDPPEAEDSLEILWSRQGPSAGAFDIQTASGVGTSFSDAGSYVVTCTVTNEVFSTSITWDIEAGRDPASTTDLDRYEPFDGQHGLATQGTGSGYDTGRLGQAVTFAGNTMTWLQSQAYILSEDPGLSVMAWIRLEAVADSKNRTLVQQLDGTGTGRTWLSVAPGGALVSFLGGAGLEGGTIPVDTWCHVAVTAGKGEGVTLYVNGTEVATSPSVIEANTASFRIGNFKNTSLANQWVGAVDEFRVYSRVLSGADITAAFFHAPAFQQDGDADGMDDEWEELYNVENPDGDEDQDGISNLLEFQAGTHPGDADSGLRMVDLSVLADGLRVRWRRGRIAGGPAPPSPLRMQTTNNLSDPDSWSPTGYIAPPDIEGEDVSLPEAEGFRAYRLRADPE